MTRPEMRDILSIVALESGVEDDAPPSVERLVAALMDSPHLRDFLRLAVKPHLSALVREWRGEPKQRRNGPGRLLATAPVTNLTETTMRTAEKHRDEPFPIRATRSERHARPVRARPSGFCAATL